MNVFYLDETPLGAAEAHCDKHVVKMILEYAQLLSTAHRVLDGSGIVDTASGRKTTRWHLPDARDATLYKATHINHPSAVWARESSGNYDWLYVLWRELLTEYKARYFKSHACEKLIIPLKRLPYNIVQNPFSMPPQAMPDIYKVKGDSITAYRNYYRGDKIRFAKWKTGKVPSWFVPLPGVNDANLSVSE